MANANNNNIGHNAYAVMRGFVNEGILSCAIEQREFFPRGLTKYVRFKPETEVLRILLAGPCPVCHSLHMRKICNQKYANKFIVPIMTLVFPIITDVRVVRCTDADLEAIVWANDSRILTPFSADK